MNARAEEMKGMATELMKIVDGSTNVKGVSPGSAKLRKMVAGKGAGNTLQTDLI